MPGERARDDAGRLARKRQTLQTLLAGLKDGDEYVRYRAPEALYEAGGLEFYGHGIARSLDDEVDRELRPKILLALADALEDADRDVRSEAVYFLALSKDIPSAAEGRLLEALRDRDATVRVNAATAICQLHEISAAAVPGLVRAVSDESPQVSNWAVKCLHRLGKRAVPGIKEALTTAPEKDRALLRSVLQTVSAEPDR